MVCAVILVAVTLGKSARTWPFYVVIAATGIIRSFLWTSATPFAELIVPKAVYAQAAAWNVTVTYAGNSGTAAANVNALGDGTLTSAAFVDVWSRLATALAEVYKVDGSGADAAVLRFGYDDGLMYEIEVGSGGAVKFEEWSDRDCEIALASPKTMDAMSQSDALQLWTWLAQRQVAKIRELAWQS